MYTFHMTEPLILSRSYCATHTDGHLVLFSVLPGVEPMDVLKKNRMRRLNNYAYAMIFGFTGW